MSKPLLTPPAAPTTEVPDLTDLTPAEIAGLKEGLAAMDRGEGIPLEEVRTQMKAEPESPSPASPDQ